MTSVGFSYAAPPSASQCLYALLAIAVQSLRCARHYSLRRTIMKKLIAAVLLLSASTAALAASPTVRQFVADCTGSCPGCPDSK